MSIIYVPKYVYLTYPTTSWTVPTDWNSANNTIHLIGSQGGNVGGYGASGGAAYTQLKNVVLTPSAVVPISIIAGSAGATTFNTTYYANNGRIGATGGVGGAGGTAMPLTGYAVISNPGGAGESSTSGGGGGAGGPNGAGLPGAGGYGGAGDAGFGGAGGIPAGATTSGTSGSRGTNILAAGATNVTGLTLGFGSGGGGGGGGSSLSYISGIGGQIGGGPGSCLFAGLSSSYGAILIVYYVPITRDSIKTGLTFNIANSDGSASSTQSDIADVFVKKNNFLSNELFFAGSMFYGFGPFVSATYYLPTRLGGVLGGQQKNNWIQSSSGGFQTMLIAADGTLWGQGACGRGESGIGYGGGWTNGFTWNSYTSPIQVGSLNNWKQVSAGQWHSAAVKTDGTLWSWGWNNYGQLGVDTSALTAGLLINHSSPVQVGALTTWNTTAAGTAGALFTDYCGYGITTAHGGVPYMMTAPTVGATSGALWGWGDAYTSSAGPPYLGNGSLSARFSSPVQIGALTTWSKISIARQKAFGIAAGGLYVWGAGDAYGGLGTGTFANLSTPTRIGASASWTWVACTSLTGAGINAGRLFTWGYSGSVSTYRCYSSPIQIGALTTWKQVEAYGSYSYYALQTNGTMWNVPVYLNARPAYAPAQMGVATNWKQITPGYGAYAAINTLGQLFTWGQDNMYGKLGQNFYDARAYPLANGGYPATGTDAYGNPIIPYYSTPVQVGALTNWSYVACGYAYFAAIKTDGTLWTWGANQFGQLGLGNTTYYSSPIQVGTLTTWRQVGISGWTMFGTTSDGKLWSWGKNTLGELGIGVESGRIMVPYSSPIQVGTMSNWSQVSCGYNTTLALKTDGTLWGWGDGSNSILGGPTYSSPIQIGSLSNWSYVDCGRNHALALQIGVDNNNNPISNLYGWGTNTLGALGNGGVAGNGTVTYLTPTPISNATSWKSIATGYDITVGVRTDGTLWTMGNNYYGLMGVGAAGQLGTTGVPYVTFYSSPVQVGALTNWKSVAKSQSGFGAYYILAIKTDGTLWGWGYDPSGFGVQPAAPYSYSSPIQIGTMSGWRSVSGSWSGWYGINSPDLP